MSVGQGAFIGSVFFAVFFTALVAQIWYTLTGKAARPADHRFMSVNRLQAILKHVLQQGNEGDGAEQWALGSMKGAVYCDRAVLHAVSAATSEFNQASVSGLAGHGQRVMG